MTCAYRGCGNDARYVNDRGELCCATCPLKASDDSIRLSNVPALLAWARRYARYLDATPSELRSIIGKDASQ